MHVHFIAVAGTGMGSLAGLFKAAGHQVSGSDVAFYPPMGPALEPTRTPLPSLQAAVTRASPQSPTRSTSRS